MGFGTNPYAPKAEAAEQKAQMAPDRATEVRAWLEAAHLWERAAAREQPGKRRLAYEQSAEQARGHAEEPVTPVGKEALEQWAPRLKLVTAD